jgi:putative NADPH-quinone reductase
MSLKKVVKDFELYEDEIHFSKTLPQINYVFNEPNILKEVQEYIDTTYSQHYAGKRKKGKKKIQTTEYLVSCCKNPEEAFRFTIQKYVDRYGKKEGYNKKDLLKAVHYLIMLLNYHNENLEEKCE